jgi:hypothetical protein
MLKYNNCYKGIYVQILFKYLFWLLSFFFLFIYYLLGTTLGHLTIGHLSEDYLSEKMNNKLEILALDLEQYPYIDSKIKINEGAILLLEGNFDVDNLDMKYDVKGESFQWNRSYIPYPIRLQGKLNGKSSHLSVMGEGNIFEGNTTYSFLHSSKYLEDLKISLNDINATQLLTFLKYRTVLLGKMDIEMQFDYYSAYKKKGSSSVVMDKVWLPDVSNEVPFSLNAKVIFKDLIHEFNANLNSEVANLKVENAYFNKPADILEANYTLAIDELGYFEPLLKHAFRGKLTTTGHIEFEQDNVFVNGTTPSLEGLLGYQYRDDFVEFDFEGISLEKILYQLEFPALLSSKVFGTASYDIKNEIILVNTKLKEARFRRTNLVDKIYQVTGINILDGVYNNSLFTAGYQDAILTSYLQIDNGINHLYMRDMRMNAKNNEITSDFEVKIDGEEFFGEIYGTLENPQVKLDMGRLIKYHINKRIENFFN